MKKLRDFKCTQCSAVQERLVKDDVDSLLCKECGGESTRQVGAPAGSGNAAHGFMSKARGGQR